MRKTHAVFALCGVLVLTPAGPAQDGARAVVEKAIQSQGGAAKVAKLRTMRIKVEGKAELVPGQPAVPFTIEDTWQMPDKYRTESAFEAGGQKLTQTQVIDGDKGWMRVNGQVQDMPKEAVAEMREQKYAEDLDRLGFLGARGVEISLLDEIKVGEKPAAGVLVKSKGHRDVKLYFDKASGLLAKREHAVLDPATGKDVRQEVVFGDYQEKDGLKHYQTITVLRGGKKVIDARVTDLEFLEKLDTKIFAKP